MERAEFSLSSDDPTDVNKRLTAICTQSSPWNFGMYLSPRATSELFSGLKRHTTLIEVSAASAISAAVGGWSAASSRQSDSYRKTGSHRQTAPLTEMLRLTRNCPKIFLISSPKKQIMNVGAAEPRIYRSELQLCKEENFSDLRV